MAEVLIPRDKSVIVAADVVYNKFPKLVEATWDIPEIGGYKVGLSLALSDLINIVDTVRDYTDKPIIYDHQKAGNDIPAMGTEFAKVCKEANVNAVILFPFSSPVTQEYWTKASQDAGLTVLTGGHMTHEKFLSSEGGYITDDAPVRIYTLAAELGVRDFVVPGNKVEYVRRYRELLEGILGTEPFRLYAPGFIKQGGEISEFALEAGAFWHAIVGSAIYGKEETTIGDMRTSALQVTSKLRTA